jgi:hypothetical protein
MPQLWAWWRGAAEGSGPSFLEQAGGDRVEPEHDDVVDQMNAVAANGLGDPPGRCQALRHGLVQEDVLPRRRGQLDDLGLLVGRGGHRDDVH